MLLALFAAALVPAGCAREMVAGIFISRPSSTEVDMIRLVESPPGRLNGSLVISSLRANGSRKPDDTVGLAGSITGANVSLRLQGLPALAKWFGSSDNFVGTLRGRYLNLSAGAATQRFREVTESRYHALLGDLRRHGHQIAAGRRASAAVHRARAAEQRLDAEMKAYIAWGRQRVARAPAVRAWYSERISDYRRCLRLIQPLAAAGVSSWRWQQCVLSIENDAYWRDRERKSIARDIESNRRAVADIRGKIASEQSEFNGAVALLKAACPFEADSARCAAEAGALDGRLPWGDIDPSLVKRFRSQAPEIEDALGSDARVSAEGQRTLLGLSSRAERLYHSARKP